MIGDPAATAAIARRVDDARRARRPASRRCSTPATPPATLSTARARDDQRRADPLQGRHLGDRPGPAARRRRGRGRCRRPRSSAGRHGGAVQHPPGALGPGPPRGPWSRLRRARDPADRPRPRRRRPRRCAPLLERRSDPSLRLRARSAWSTACSSSSTRPPRRSASWATTPRRCASALRGDELLQLALGSPDGRGRRARAHPLGVDRHHLRAERPPAVLRRAGRRRGPVRHRRAQRRRRQLRRSDRVGVAAHRRRDHHRRQGHPDADVAAARRRASHPATPSARRSPRSTGSVAIAAATVARARPPLPGARAAVVRRIYVGLAEDAYIVASEPYGVVEETAHLPAHGRRDAGGSRQPHRQPGPDHRAARRRAGIVDGMHPVVLRRDRARRGRRRRADRPGHHPRHRPWRVPALPAQGDHRVAGVVPQDAARQARRGRRRHPGRARSRVPARRRPGRAASTARSTGCW